MENDKVNSDLNLILYYCFFCLQFSNNLLKMLDVIRGSILRQLLKLCNWRCHQPVTSTLFMTTKNRYVPGTDACCTIQLNISFQNLLTTAKSVILCMGSQYLIRTFWMWPYITCRQEPANYSAIFPLSLYTARPLLDSYGPMRYFYTGAPKMQATKSFCHNCNKWILTSFQNSHSHTRVVICDKVTQGSVAKYLRCGGIFNITSQDNHQLA